MKGLNIKSIEMLQVYRSYERFVLVFSKTSDDFIYQANNPVHSLILFIKKNLNPFQVIAVIIFYQVFKVKVCPRFLFHNNLALWSMMTPKKMKGRAATPSPLFLTNHEKKIKLFKEGGLGDHMTLKFSFFGGGVSGQRAKI